MQLKSTQLKTNLFAINKSVSLANLSKIDGITFL